MSIATRTGDNGETALMYGKRVPKDHIRVETYGTLDELNAALGLARATASHPLIREGLLSTQKDLVALMGELAVSNEDHDKYQSSEFPRTTPEMLQRLDGLVKELEALSIRFEGWATPGQNLHAGFLDLSRTICRRAERRVYTLRITGNSVREIVVHYLNRLSDVLWLMARLAETP